GWLGRSAVPQRWLPGRWDCEERYPLDRSLPGWQSSELPADPHSGSGRVAGRGRPATRKGGETPNEWLTVPRWQWEHGRFFALPKAHPVAPVALAPHRGTAGILQSLEYKRLPDR